MADGSYAIDAAYDEADGECVRLTCPSCSRKFNPSSYERHQRVCQQVFGTSRPPFDPMRRGSTASTQPTSAPKEESEIREVSANEADPKLCMMPPQGELAGGGQVCRETDGIAEEEQRMMSLLHAQMEEVQEMKRLYNPFAPPARMHYGASPEDPEPTEGAAHAGIDKAPDMAAPAVASKVLQVSSCTPSQSLSSSTGADAYAEQALAESSDSTSATVHAAHSLRMCEDCGRRFNPASFEKHRQVCRSVFGKSSRRPFESQNQRLRSLDAVSGLQEQSAPPAPPPPPPAASSSDAQTHQPAQVVAQLMRGGTASVAAAPGDRESPKQATTSAGTASSSVSVPAGINLRRLTSPIRPLDTCPHCGRSFRPGALEKHASVCQKVFPTTPCTNDMWGGKRVVQDPRRQRASPAAASASESHSGGSHLTRNDPASSSQRVLGLLAGNGHANGRDAYSPQPSSGNWRRVSASPLSPHADINHGRHSASAANLRKSASESLIPPQMCHLSQQEAWRFHTPSNVHSEIPTNKKTEGEEAAVPPTKGEAAPGPASQSLVQNASKPSSISMQRRNSESLTLSQASTAQVYVDEPPRTLEVEPFSKPLPRSSLAQGVAISSMDRSLGLSASHRSPAPTPAGDPQPASKSTDKKESTLPKDQSSQKPPLFHKSARAEGESALPHGGVRPAEQRSQSSDAGRVHVQSCAQQQQQPQQQPQIAPEDTGAGPGTPRQLSDLKVLCEGRRNLLERARLDAKLAQQQGGGGGSASVAVGGGHLASSASDHMLHVVQTPRRSTTLFMGRELQESHELSRSSVDPQRQSAVQAEPVARADLSQSLRCEDKATRPVHIAARIPTAARDATGSPERIKLRDSTPGGTSPQKKSFQMGGSSPHASSPGGSAERRGRSADGGGLSPMSRFSRCAQHTDGTRRTTANPPKQRLTLGCKEPTTAAPPSRKVGVQPSPAEIVINAGSPTGAKPQLRQRIIACPSSDSTSPSNLSGSIRTTVAPTILTVEALSASAAAAASTVCRTKRPIRADEHGMDATQATVAAQSVGTCSRSAVPPLDLKKMSQDRFVPQPVVQVASESRLH